MSDTRSIPELRDQPVGSLGRRPEDGGADTLKRGAALGRYLVLYPVGRGGMGEVYAAYDPELDRKVALKLLRSELALKEPDLARREARALARLTHSNVVTVHDIGTFEGRVFLAMEFIDGTTLKAWYRERPRGWQEVLEVFLAAGRGLAAAHGEGLVHRDFKPSNVMLSRRGGVRVMDFGLARVDVARVERVDPASPGATRAADVRAGEAAWYASLPSLLGTPAYLAPERLAGRPADARSDQFSFCVALYQMLYGELPVAAADLEGYAGEFHRRRFREPPAGVRVPAWVRQVVLRGMSPVPEGRHPGLDALLADLDPAPRRRRRRGWLMAAAILTAAVPGAFYLASRPAAVPPCTDGGDRLAGVWDEPRRARVGTAFAAVDRPGAAEIFEGVAASLDRYLGAWRAQHLDACEATRVRGVQSERLLDARMHCLDGRLAQVRALTEQLATLDEGHLPHASRAVIALSPVSDCAATESLLRLAPLPANPAARAELARILDVVEEQNALYHAGRDTDLAAVERAAADARRLDYEPLAANALLTLGILQTHVSGDTERGFETYKEALWAALAGGDGPLEARLYARLARGMAYEKGRIEEARMWGRFARAALRSLGSGHEALEVGILSDLTVFADTLGDSDEAIAFGRRAVELAERFHGPESYQLAAALDNLALPLGSRPEGVEEAAAMLIRSLAIEEKLPGRPAPSRFCPKLINMGSAAGFHGRYAEALELTERCLVLSEVGYDEGHRALTYPRLLKGFVLVHLDRVEEGMELLEKARATARAGFGEHHPLYAKTLHVLGDGHLLLGQLDEAAAHFFAAGKIYRESLPADDSDHALLLLSRGELAVARGRSAEAVPLLEKALAGLRAAPLLNERDLSALLVGLGEAQLDLGRPDRARETLEEALELPRTAVLPHLEARARLALARSIEGEAPERARQLAGQALEGFQSLAAASPATRARERAVKGWLADR